jgi:hypothetical protein
MRKNKSLIQKENINRILVTCSSSIDDLARVKRFFEFKDEIEYEVYSLKRFEDEGLQFKDFKRQVFEIHRPPIEWGGDFKSLRNNRL